MTEEQIIEFMTTQYGPWKSTAMFLIGVGSGFMSSIIFGLAVIVVQRRALKGKSVPS